MNGAKKKKAIKMLAAGHTGTEVGKATGTSDAAVSRLRNREDIKPILDAGFRELVTRAVGSAVDNTVKIIEAAQKYQAELSQKETVDPKDYEKAKVLFDLAGKKEKRVFDAAGFGSPQAQSVHLLNITNSFNQSLAPAVIDLLAAALPSAQNITDIIDIDLELNNEDLENSD